MSLTRFLHSLRVETARQLLIHTDRAVGEIALETGYHDQSHFTRHFRRLTAMTPGHFRARFRGSGKGYMITPLPAFARDWRKASETPSMLSL